MGTARLGALIEIDGRRVPEIMHLEVTGTDTDQRVRPPHVQRRDVLAQTAREGGVRRNPAIRERGNRRNTRLYSLRRQCVAEHECEPDHGKKDRDPHVSQHSDQEDRDREHDQRATRTGVDQGEGTSDEHADRDRSLRDGRCREPEVDGEDRAGRDNLPEEIETERAAAALDTGILHHRGEPAERDLRQIQLALRDRQHGK